MQTALSGILWAPAGICAVAAAVVTRQKSETAWRVLAFSTRCVVGIAILIGIPALPGSTGHHRDMDQEAPAIFMALIAWFGWVIGDYSRRYLLGEPAQTRYTVSFLTTLSGVSAVVSASDLLMLIAAWGLSSAGLHQLLIFYRDRPAAMLVAHKKVLASRAAEACLIIAALLRYGQWGSFDLAGINESARSTTVLPQITGLAATLIATAVLTKCAHLPLHGWLTQVMGAGIRLLPRRCKT